MFENELSIARRDGREIFWFEGRKHKYGCKFTIFIAFMLW